MEVYKCYLIKTLFVDFIHHTIHHSTTEFSMTTYPFMDSTYWFLKWNQKFSSESFSSTYTFNIYMYMCVSKGSLLDVSMCGLTIGINDDHTPFKSP